MVAKKKPVDAAVIAKVQEKTVGAVTTQLAASKVALIGCVDEISNKTSALLVEFAEVTAAIESKRAELKELYALEAEAGKLEEVQQERRAAEEEATKEIDARDTEREREEEEYQYNLARKHREQIDKFERQLVELKTKFDADLAAKTAALNAEKAALGDTKNSIEALTKELMAQSEQAKKDVAAAGEAAARRATRDLEHKHAIEGAKLAQELALLHAANASLSERLVDLEDDLIKAKQDVKEAQAQARDVAIKAIDGASAQRIVVNAGSNDSQPTRKS